MNSLLRLGKLAMLAEREEKKRVSAWDGYTRRIRERELRNRLYGVCWLGCVKKRPVHSTAPVCGEQCIGDFIEVYMS